MAGSPSSPGNQVSCCREVPAATIATSPRYSRRVINGTRGYRPIDPAYRASGGSRSGRRSVQTDRLDAENAPARDKADDAGVERDDPDFVDAPR